MVKSCEYEIVYLSLFGSCGFYSPCVHCLDEHMHLWDMELLAIMVGFYCLSMANRLSVLVRYSLAVLYI